MQEPTHTQNTENITTVNAHGLACPKPLLLTKKALTDLLAGQQLMVYLDDAQSIEDISYFCQASGHTLVAYTQIDAGYQLIIQKRL